MKPSNYLPRLGFVFAVLSLLSGCLLKSARDSTRHFVLAPIPAPEHTPAVAERLAIGVRFVKMPSYLLQDSMAVRNGANEIEYLENALWAERLDQSFQQTLAANLSTLLPSDRVYLSLWERGQVALIVVVNVEQFEVDTQGRGTLVASWRITAPDGDKPLKSGEARLARTGPPPRGNPHAIAATLSTLTAEFSRKLAEAIHESAQTTHNLTMSTETATKFNDERTYVSSELPESIDGLPDFCGAEQQVESTVQSNRGQGVFLPQSRIDFGRIRSAFTSALHMHQPIVRS